MELEQKFRFRGDTIVRVQKFIITWRHDLRILSLQTTRLYFAAPFKEPLKDILVGFFKITQAKIIARDTVEVLKKRLSESFLNLYMLKLLFDGQLNRNQDSCHLETEKG